MADRNGLKLIGILFATVTFAVMSPSVLVVKFHADGNDVIENTATAMPSR